MKFATLCFLKRNDKVLMIHRNKRDSDTFKGFWNGLGGKMQDSESPGECIIREFWEESGLTIANPQLKGILTFTDYKLAGETWHVFVYIATEFSGELKENEEGTLSWVPADQVPQLKMQPADRHFIKWLDGDKIFAAKFTFKENQIASQEVRFY